MALDVFTLQGCFGSTSPDCRIGNSYSRPLPPAPHLVSPESPLLDLEFPYLVADDFNIYNPAADPSRILSSTEERESAPHFDQAADLGFTLPNTRSIYTRFPFTGTHRPSLIDLAFVNPHMFSAFRSWEASSLPSTESDHPLILIPPRPPSLHHNKPRPHWQEANSPSLEDKLNGWLIPPPPEAPSPNQLEQWFSSALYTLTTTIEASAPHSRLSPRSEPWWTPLLTTLRKELTKTSQRAKKLQTADAWGIRKMSERGPLGSRTLLVHQGGLWSPWSTWYTPIHSDPHFFKFYRKCGPMWIKVDQEDQGDHNPPCWTRSAFYILLMLSHSQTLQARLLQGH